MEIKIKSWNIQGFPKSKSAAKKLLKMQKIAQLFESAKFDEICFIAIQESKIHTQDELKQVFSEFQIVRRIQQGWGYSWAPCKKQGADARSYSAGVLLFWKCPRNVQVIPCDLPFDDPDYSSCYTLVQLRYQSTSILIGSVYLRSKHQIDVNNVLLKQIAGLRNTHNFKDVILAGDFNFHTPKPPIWQVIDPLSQIMQQPVRHYNHDLSPTYPNQKLLDYVLSSVPLRNLTISSPEANYTDHYILETSALTFNPLERLNQVEAELKQRRKQQQSHTYNKKRLYAYLLSIKLAQLLNWVYLREIRRRKANKILLGKSIYFLQRVKIWMIL